jgi:hypothetical protein
MLSSKSRAHMARVLLNQAKAAAAERATADEDRPDCQLKIPLIVEVKRNAAAKQRARRGRQKSAGDQPDLGEL